MRVLILKEWKVCDLDKQAVSDLAEQCEIDLFLAMLLYIKGIETKEQVEQFLSDEIVLSDPFEYKDMQKAVERIEEAILKDEKVCIYGDYDADGITSTVLLYEYFKSLGINVMYYIPKRLKSGYGLNDLSISWLKKKGVDLIVTVDNGIVAFEQIAYAKELGIDVVVTDHHTQENKKIPEQANAVVDPHRYDCPSTSKNLAGVGVAFKLASAINSRREIKEDLLEKYGDILMIGTVADIVPLTGENRSIVKYALKKLKDTNRVGLLALFNIMNIRRDSITSTDIGFKIAPRINATGRLDCSEKSIELLMAGNYSKAYSLAEFVEETNDKRRNIESEIFDEVERNILSDPLVYFKRIITVVGEDYHTGVIGIVASKISSRYGRPTIVISKNSRTGIATASGRSVEGFSLYDTVYSAKKLLTQFGGHKMAVGFSLKSTDIDTFIEEINAYAKKHFDRMPDPVLSLDCKLNPSMVNLDLARQISKLEPFGTSNSVPLIGFSNLKIKKIYDINGKHLKIIFTKNNAKLDTIYFWHTFDNFQFKIGDEVDIVTHLEVSNYKKSDTLSMVVKDLHFSEFDYKKLADEKHIYFKLMCEKTVVCSNLDEHIPGRDDFAIFYRFITNLTKTEMKVDAILYRLRESNISYVKLHIMIDVFVQMNLINFRRDGDTYFLSVRPVARRVNLENSDILRSVKQLRV